MGQAPSACPISHRCAPSIKLTLGVLIALSIVVLSGGLVWAIGNNGFLAFQLTGSFLGESPRFSRRRSRVGFVYC